MASSDVQRKLTAIFCTDVVGYSRLMGDDTEGTLATLMDYREVFSDKIQECKGRVVNAPGDSLLAEFPSVLDAVSCAVDIQRELAERNRELPDERRMDFRIGVNLGDVLMKEGDIFGDGVNVAARLESLAEPGGICISGSVHEQVKNRLPLHYESIGKQRVKNIAEPVKTYRVHSKRGSVAGRDARMKQTFPEQAPALPLPDKLSIAVLAFDNLSDDPEQEFFSEGMSEDIITTLAKIPEMFVIARNSSFVYKGKPVKVQQVGEELGVRYVLQGSVQKAGERIRVTAQLIDAVGGEHLWAERYDREFQDLFALQDEITLKIVKSLQVELSEGEQSFRLNHSTEDLQAWEASAKALTHFYRLTPEDNVLTREYLEKAIEFDPDFAWAYAGIGWTYLMEAARGWSPNPAQAIGQAKALAEKALGKNEAIGLGHALLGRIYTTENQYDKAITEGERMLTLEPNNPEMHMIFAYTLNFVGRPEEALIWIEKAKRLHPHHPPAYFLVAGTAYYLAGRYKESISEFKESLKQNPQDYIADVNLAANYAALGRKKEARLQAVEVLRKDPKFSARISAEKGFGSHKNPEIKEHFLDRLCKAGLPE